MSVTRGFSGLPLLLSASILMPACGGRVDTRSVEARSAQGAGGSAVTLPDSGPGGSTNAGSTGTAGTTIDPPSSPGAPNVGGSPAFGGAPNASAGASNPGTPSGGAPNVIDAGAGGSSSIPGAGTDVRSYLLAQVTAEGHLIGARWTGTEETVSLIDPATTNAEVVGVLGDLYSWSGGLTYDRAASSVYAAGQDAAGAAHLYSLSLDSRRSGSVPLERMYAFADVVDDGRVIAAYWSGSAEEVVLIDPATGLATPAGALGDLTWWSSQLAYDRETRTVHAIGGTASNSAAYSLYSLSLDAGTCTKVPLERSYTIAKVTHGGRIMGAYWAGSEEPIVSIDPTSGVASAPTGVLGDLMWWQNQLAYDPSARVLYAIGQNASDVAHIYHVDLGG